MADNKLEKYILEHISEEGLLLEELFRKTHTSAVNPNMISGHLQGKILEMFVRMISPSRILEIGTFTGYSAICMAGALKEGGELHTIEINDELSGLNEEFFRRSGFSGRIIMHTGDAKTVIPALDQSFDMVFIDGDKREYSLYYDLVFDKTRSGGFIIVDNVLWGGKVVEETSDPMTRGIQDFNRKVKHDERVENVILPVRDGLMIIRKQ